MPWVSQKKHEGFTHEQVRLEVIKIVEALANDPIPVLHLAIIAAFIAEQKGLKEDFRKHVALVRKTFRKELTSEVKFVTHSFRGPK